MTPTVRSTWPSCPLAAPVLAGDADLVLGRRVPKPVSAWPAHARLANAVLARLVRRACGCGCTIWGRCGWPGAPTCSPSTCAIGAALPLEVVLRAAAQGWRVRELPVDYRPRVGRSKVTGTVRGTWHAVHDMRRRWPTARWWRHDHAGGGGQAARAGRVKTRLHPRTRWGRRRCWRTRACTTPWTRWTACWPRAAFSSWTACCRTERAGCSGGSRPELLDERIACKFDRLTGPMLLVGMDTLNSTRPRWRAPSLIGLDEVDAFFGPADDGGYWAIGLREPDGALVRGVPMSRVDTGSSSPGWPRRGCGWRTRRRCATSTPPPTWPRPQHVLAWPQPWRAWRASA